jgi:DNA-binding GntR family transcriptional regulator
VTNQFFFAISSQKPDDVKKSMTLKLCKGKHPIGSCSIVAEKLQIKSDAGKRLLTDNVYLSLRQDIIECVFQPGERITEAQVAEQYEVGKTPAREALRRLITEGLVQLTETGAYQVAPITLRNVQELFELRLMLEPATVALAVNRIDNATLKQLKALSEVRYDAKKRSSVRDFLRQNAEFHARIAHSSNNQRVAALLDQLLLECDRLVHFGVLSHPQSEQTQKEHRQLVEAIASKNVGLAHDTSKEHIRATERMVMASLLSDTRLRDMPIR